MTDSFNNIEIIEQKFEEYTLNNMDEVLKHIERCGKNCYKSEKNITETSAEKFIDNILKSGHESVIEHAHFIFKMKIEDAELLFNKIGYPALSELRGLNITQYSDDRQTHYYIISGNPRTFRDIYRVSGVYVFLDKLPEIFSKYLGKDGTFKLTGKTVEPETYELVGIQKSDYGDKHNYYTFRFDTSISTYKDITRHRNLSWSIESTRYCVAGDTKLKFSNAHHNYNVKDLYNKIHVNPPSNASWKRIKIRQLNENTGVLEFAKIKDVLYMGKKPVLQIKTRLGYELKCTKEHPIYSKDGYIEAGNLTLGNEIYINGKDITEKPLYQDKDWLYYQNITLNKTFAQIAKEFSFNANTVKKWGAKLALPKKGTGYFNKGRIPWNKDLHEKDDSRVKIQADTLREFRWDKWHDTEKLKKLGKRSYRKMIKDTCEICSSKEGLQVHHIDCDREHNDNNPNNLITLCPKCHAGVHSKNLTIAVLDPVVEIKELPAEDVYDIVMDSEYHNFVANGVIVHNCNYSRKNENGKIKIVDCSYFMTLQEHQLYLNEMDKMAAKYNVMAKDFESKPDVLRMILPHGTAASVVMSGSVYDLKKMLALRTDIHAHPTVQHDMKEIENLIQKDSKEILFLDRRMV